MEREIRIALKKVRYKLRTTTDKVKINRLRADLVALKEKQKALKLKASA